MSETTVKILQTFSATETSKTATYCHILDQFFDCFNVRSLEKNQKKTKPFMKPHTDENDQRFSWMTDQFLPYLDIWKENTRNRPDNFTKNPISKMFFSLQINHGIQITVRSTVEEVKFLLQNGSKFILNERFCQDPVEEYFRIQRQLGRKN